MSDSPREKGKGKSVEWLKTFNYQVAETFQGRCERVCGGRRVNWEEDILVALTLLYG